MKKTFRMFAALSALVIGSAIAVSCSDGDGSGSGSVTVAELPPSVGTNELAGKTLVDFHSESWGAYSTTFTFTDTKMIEVDVEDGETYEEKHSYSYSYDSEKKMIYARMDMPPKSYFKAAVKEEYEYMKDKYGVPEFTENEYRNNLDAMANRYYEYMVNGNGVVVYKYELSEDGTRLKSLVEVFPGNCVDWKYLEFESNSGFWFNNGGVSYAYYPKLFTRCVYILTSKTDTTATFMNIEDPEDVVEYSWTYEKAADSDRWNLTFENDNGKISLQSYSSNYVYTNNAPAN